MEKEVENGRKRRELELHPLTQYLHIRLRLGGEEGGSCPSIGSSVFASFFCELPIEPSCHPGGGRRKRYGVSTIITCGILIMSRHPFMTLHILPGTFEAFFIFPPHFISLGPRFTDGISSQLVLLCGSHYLSKLGSSPHPSKLMSFPL